jgi:MoxR-like ATPase
MLKGRAFVNTEDVREVAAPVLRHRIITNFNAEADGVSPDTIVSRLTELVPADSSKATRVGRLPEVFRSADAGEARRA